jgi:GNAT superfamily N-acetyltransferase/8-oxo-dGTP pyrophosphatase MutT (NUDIX family)
VVIRPAVDGDREAIWQIFHAVVSGRDSYAFAPDTSRDEGVGYWFGPEITSFVAEIDGRVVGMYKLIANRSDLGSHVSNASFMVDPAAAGHGVGRAMGVHCLHEARMQGYEAMQFNFVVSTNRRAVALWQDLGFEILATLPRAFQHGTLGLVDAYVMHRDLGDIVLTFGASPADAAAIVRPCGYAVIANDRRQLAAVEAEEGTLLPGGGREAGEALDAAVIREVQEECALRIRVTGSLGDAVQFVNSRKMNAHFEKRSTFVAAAVESATRNVPEHRTLWLEPAMAIDTVTYDSHAWAIRRWVRLNT